MAEPKESYARCIVNPKFIDRFYEIFIESHPDIKPLFKNTDWEKQKELLRKGVSMMILFENNDPVATSVLNRIDEFHSPRGTYVDPKLYPYWVDSLLATVEEFDQKFSPEVEVAWRRVLNKGINFIVSKN